MKKGLKAIHATLAAREQTHGGFTEVAALAGQLIEAMQNAPNWRALPPRQRAALHQIAFKQARILCGDNWFADHWDDISGYCQLARPDPRN